MKIVNYKADTQWHSGLATEFGIVDTNALLARIGQDPVSGNRALLERSEIDLSALGKVIQDHLPALRKDGAIHDRTAVHLGPPIPDPEKIVCIGLNYHDHAEEVGATAPDTPIFFAKYANSLIGWQDDILPPSDTNKVDYEAELAVIIGKPGRYVSEAEALSHVAGAMAFNDVSARDLQLANQLWTGGKAIDTFGPCGAELVTMDEVGDIQNLGVQTRRNGKLLQDGNTSNMIFNVPQIISFLSRIMTLRPGDIIATGTPAGVAAAHDPAQFLQEGDTVEVSIEKIGLTRNKIGAFGALPQTCAEPEV